MESCPKCKSPAGCYFKNTGSVRENVSFSGEEQGWPAWTVSRRGEKAFCINCNRRLPEMDRENKPKEKEYWKVIADGKEQGIFPKSQKQKERSLKNLAGIKLVTATKEEISKYGG